MKMPFVSIMMPTYNEGKYIKKALDALLSQSYPKNKFEIVIADGDSSDNTRKIIKEYMKKNKNIRLFRNPKRSTTIGRNICLEKSKGDILINYSGHAVAEKNFIKILVSKLQKSKKNVGAVGCSNISPKDANFTSKCISIVYNSLLGGFKSVDQNVSYKSERYVRSMAFTAYRKEIFDEIGGFDPELWVGQDGELNLRLNKAGYKLLYTPKTFVYLHRRDNIYKFWRQIYRYGVGAFQRIKKHPDSFRLFYIIPSLFVISLLFFIALSFFGSLFQGILIGFVIFYILSCLTSSLIVSRKILPVLASPLFYFILHFGYGFGFIKSIILGGFKVSNS